MVILSDGTFCLCLADNSGSFDYTISSFGRSSSDSVDINVVTNNGDPIEGDANNNILIADPNGGAVNFYGRQGDDVVVGSNADDDLKGNLGDDLIIGGLGNDIINGGNNEDIIVGGLGNDTLTGDGAEKQNSNVFKWLADDGDKGIDTVTDFEIDYDKLDLSELLIGESMENIEKYLSLEIVNGNFVIDIYADGDNNNRDAYDQQIVLEALDLTVTQRLGIC